MLRPRLLQACGSFPRSGRLVLLAGLLAGLSGCAYYNTFYLARKYYTQGEQEQRKETTGRLSPTAADRWDKSIKQAQKVLKRYPDSKWVDDALFLVGKGYFSREEYGSSRQYFQQMLDSYPQSEFALEARFWMARTWAAESDYVRANEAFKEILAAGPPATWADQVLFAQGEVEFAREDYGAAVEHYRELVARYPNGTRAFDALMRTGDASFQRRQWVDAQKAYTMAMPRAREPRERLDLRLKSGQCLEKQEKYDEALELYRQTALELVPLGKYNQIIADPMAGVTVNPNDPAKTGSNNPDEPGYNPSDNQNNGIPDPSLPGSANFGGTQSQAQYQQSGDANRRAASDAIQQNPLAGLLPRILLRQGLCLSARGDQAGAISTFRIIVTAYRGTAEASEAQYRVGYINEVELQDYTAARKAYDDVKTQGASLFGEQATKRSGNLARLIALAAADTAKGEKATKKSREAEAERAFLGAELFMFQQDKPDKALEQYVIVEADFPRSSFAPRAALARAWILTNAQGDTNGAAQVYRDIIEKYPGSDAWRMAYQLVHGEPPKEAPRVTPVPDSTLAAAPGSSAGVDSNTADFTAGDFTAVDSTGVDSTGGDAAGGDPRGADSTGMIFVPPTPGRTPASDASITPLPRLISPLTPADSMARAGLVPRGGEDSRAGLSGAPVVPGGVAPAEPVLLPGPGGLPVAMGATPIPGALAPVPDPTPGVTTPATTAAASVTAPPATTPGMANATAPPPSNAITPGTPHRQPSRVAKGEVAGAMPLAWVEWQRWLKSPASRRVIPAPVGSAPRPSQKGVSGGASEKLIPAAGVAPAGAGPTAPSPAAPSPRTPSPRPPKKSPAKPKPGAAPRPGGGGR